MHRLAPRGTSRVVVETTAASRSPIHRNWTRTAARTSSSSAAATPSASSSSPSPRQNEALNEETSVLNQLRNGSLSAHQLERVMGDNTAAVRLRRKFIKAWARGGGGDEQLGKARRLPIAGTDFDERAFYDAILGQNAESVIGFLPLPVGVVGPLRVDGEEVMVPLATTEGALIASTNRGARAIGLSEAGVETSVLRDGMTRSPVLQFPSGVAAADFAKWIEAEERRDMLRALFAETTRFGHLQSVRASVAGRNVFLRFRCSTGDAMGMNMVGKGVNRIIEHLMGVVPGLALVALSGNTCTDKKPSAVNWIEGRGKSVLAEVFLPREVVRDVLKTSVEDLVRVGSKKNLIGSSIAGSIGGNNAHAANVVTAVFLATGQDPAQNVESSNCITLFESLEGGAMLHASVTMPSLEVGTIGGGTSLEAQSACLDLLGVRGTSKDMPPGTNAKRLASIIAAAVLAGELSLNAALASNHLISAHMSLNRKPTGVATNVGNNNTNTGVTSASVVEGKRTSHRILNEYVPPGARRFAFSARPTGFSNSNAAAASLRYSERRSDILEAAAADEEEDFNATPKLTVP